MPGASPAALSLPETDRWKGAPPGEVVIDGGHDGAAVRSVPRSVHVPQIVIGPAVIRVFKIEPEHRGKDPAHTITLLLRSAASASRS